MHRHRTLLGVVGVLALTFTTSACTSSDGNDVAGDEAETEDGADADTTGGDLARLRALHLGVFPGDVNTGVELFVNGQASGLALEFKDGTGHTEFPAGEYDFDIVPAGGTLDDSVFSIQSFPLEADFDYTLHATGYIAPSGAFDAQFGVDMVPENPDGIPPGSTRLNIIHSAPLAAFSPVAVWIVDDGCAPVEPLIETFAHLDVVFDVDLPAGPLGLGLDLGQDDAVNACFFVPDLGAGALVNVYISNDDASVPALILHLPDGSVAEVTAEG